jgi:hypothetical protein
MDKHDFIGGIGVTLYGIGAWMISPAFFFVSTGLILLSAAVMGARKGGEKK